MDAGSGDVSKCAEHVRFQWKVEADQGGIQPEKQVGELVFVTYILCVTYP